MKTDLVVAGFIFDNDKVLLIHHKKLDMWLPPGGHIDKDETPDEALLREIKEELGIDVEILNKNELQAEGKIKKQLATPIYVNVHDIGDHDHCCLFYLCRLKNNTINVNKNELNDFKWFSIEDLNKDIISSAVRNQALKAFEILEKLK